MTRRLVPRLTAALALVVLPSSAAAAQSASQRPLRIDDLFELEQIGRDYGGPAAFSPDGRAVAFTRVRPKKTFVNHKLEYLSDNAGADVWLQSAPGAKPVNLTNGLADGSGWWAPQWSPDGKWIALLSTKGGENVTPWVWERKSGRLRQLSTHGVDLPNVSAPPFVWIDAQRLLCPLLALGEQPLPMSLERLTPQIASAAWPKAARGQEATVNVLQSGVPADLAKRPRGELRLINVSSGASTLVSSARTSDWQVSPRGDAVAFARESDIFAPRANRPIYFGHWRLSTVEVQRFEGQAPSWDKPLPGDVLAESLRWSPKGTELAFLAFVGSREQPPRLYRLNVRSGRVEDVALDDLDAMPGARQLEWTGSGQLLLAARRGKRDARDADTRLDWWLIDRTGRKRCLTNSMRSTPGELWPERGRASLVGLAAGEIWRIRATGAIENLTLRFDRRVERIFWPASPGKRRNEYTTVVFSVREEGFAAAYRLELESGAITQLSKPAAESEPIAFTPAVDAAIFSATNRRGTFLWRAPLMGGRADELMVANTFLGDIIEGQFKSLEYTGLDGEKLAGWLILPAGYGSGRRYPLIAWVYAGWVAGARPPAHHGLNNPFALNLQIPAASGYAVLMPSMPLAPEGEADDPMLKLTNGVLPAVDEAVRLGIADPQRVFLMGQSFGGFSVYGLVTQTRRFNAAVSMAGMSNLLSLYGSFDVRLRYSSYPHDNLFMPAMAEAFQGRMGRPPWQDLGRYLRNSPVFHVDRVQTPLMIVQGDLDYISIQQGEEFFTSLYRQGKRAEFVRYWGEGHVLESPANIRDLWARVFAWFNEFGSASTTR